MGSQPGAAQTTENQGKTSPFRPSRGRPELAGIHGDSRGLTPLNYTRPFSPPDRLAARIFANVLDRGLRRGAPAQGEAPGDQYREEGLTARTATRCASPAGRPADRPGRGAAASA